MIFGKNFAHNFTGKQAACFYGKNTIKSKVPELVETSGMYTNQPPERRKP